MGVGVGGIGVGVGGMGVGGGGIGVGDSGSASETVSAVSPPAGSSSQASMLISKSNP